MCQTSSAKKCPWSGCKATNLADQCHAGPRKNISDPVNIELGLTPVPRVDRISYRWEERFIIARPHLWRKQYMFELCPIWDLEDHR